MISRYYFDETIFKKNFNAKDPGEKSADTYRLNHASNNCFKLYPYKAATRNASPIVYELADAVSGFFRKALNISAGDISFSELCGKIRDKVEIENESDEEVFQDLIRSLFFKGNSFRANNVGLYAYQTMSDNKSAERLSRFLCCVFGVDESDKENIKHAERNYPFNVLEKMVIDAIEIHEETDTTNEDKYYIVKRSIQNTFKDDFSFMLSSGMTSIEDLSNLLTFYYFYYVSQSALTLDLFANGDHEKLEKIYYALDWEKVSKNRLCCIEGWDKLSNNLSRMFSHAITLEILNQNDGPMMDYIDFKTLADTSESIDIEIAEEVKSAEKVYTSYIGDYKKFETIEDVPGVNRTDSAIRHLFECVLAQFNDTDRKRASQFYAEKFTEFCKKRLIKNRKKSGLVLNLTERDIIFLTKLALRDAEKIRLNELYIQYERRGVYLDQTSKVLLQDYFTTLNLIDKKSDSGDAQYVKRIL